MRLRITLILLAFALVAFIMMSFIRPPIRQEEDVRIIRNPLSEIKKAFTILISRTCLPLSFVFFYAGIHTTFLSVAGTSMGFSKYLSKNSKEYAPLSGFVQGIGELIGGAFALYVTNILRTGRLRVVLIAAGLANMIAYIFYFLGVPNSSSFTYTDELPIVSLPMIFLFLSHLLIGAGEACLTIEIYQCLGTLYPDDSTPAFSSYKFIRWLATSFSFCYSSVLGLHAQLIILSASGLIGIISYHYVVNTSRNIEKSTHQVSQVPCKADDILLGETRENCIG